MVNFQTFLVKSAFSNHVYEDNEKWMKPYVTQILEHASNGIFALSDTLMFYTNVKGQNRLNKKQITDILSFIIYTMVGHYQHVYVKMEDDEKSTKFLVDMKPTRGIMKSLIYCLAKPYEFKEENYISYESYEEQVYKQKAIQDVISFCFKLKKESISKSLIEKGYCPDNDFIIYLVYSKQNEFLDYILKYHPFSTSRCITIYEDIKKSAEEAIRHTGEVEKYEEFIENGRRWFC